MSLPLRNLAEQPVTAEDLHTLGVEPIRAGHLLTALRELMTATQDAKDALKGAPESLWRELSQCVLQPTDPFPLHHWLYECVYRESAVCGPAWLPTEDTMAGANVTQLADSLGLPDYAALHRWSVEHRANYWRTVVEALQIRFSDEPSPQPPEGDPHCWLPPFQFNIVDSCLAADADHTAIICRDEADIETRTSYGTLRTLVDRVAVGLKRLGLQVGDRVGMMLPLTTEAVAACLGAIKAGCVPVSIAESFAPPEIAVRLNLAAARAIFVGDVICRAGRRLPCYQKFLETQHAARAIVVPSGRSEDVTLSRDDLSWTDLLGEAEAAVQVAGIPAAADSEINILFSSGTTGDPKVIPWVQSTPLKCAADARYHHNLHERSVVAWPTSMGWMMGPWLIFATLLNRGTIALFNGAPNSPGFCRFVQDAGVTMLGVIPSLVRAWRSGQMLEGLDWTAIEAFSSTGECSSPEDMLYLMSRAGYRPVIEYCGGTEIGGGYITSTIVQPNRPSCFSTPALGLDLLLVEQERPAEQGEVFLLGPSLGLSRRLLNADHEEIYFAGTPPLAGDTRLRRHGDEIERLAPHVYRAAGRTDDAMNLGGIKVSAVELERCLNALPGVQECAAVACRLTEGPAELVICVVSDNPTLAEDRLKSLLQQAISESLNPLFRVRHVLLLDALPRTASNKLMRRRLREQATIALADR